MFFRSVLKLCWGFQRGMDLSWGASVGRGLSGEQKLKKKTLQEPPSPATVDTETPSANIQLSRALGSLPSRLQVHKYDRQSVRKLSVRLQRAVKSSTVWNYENKPTKLPRVFPLVSYHGHIFCLIDVI
jgi:hypothetical protein